MTEIKENDIISEKTAVALGLFDGVHSGHKLIISKALNYTQKGFVPAVFTFRTESVKFKHGKIFEYIYTNEYKLEILGNLGVKYAFSPDFEDLKNMEGEDFVKKILCQKMNIGAVVCGENFRFGKNASCGVNELRKFGEKYRFDVSVIELSHGKFSSEKYRNMLREGKVNELRILGNTYSLCTEVTEGNKIGRTIDFPTINQHFAENQLVLKRGVYITSTVIDGQTYSSITNVGVKPTVEKDIKPLSETHILGYNGNLYGKKIKVEFLDFIRDEMKFKSIDELKKQIKKDIEYTKQITSEVVSGGKD